MSDRKNLKLYKKSFKKEPFDKSQELSGKKPFKKGNLGKSQPLPPAPQKQEMRESKNQHILLYGTHAVDAALKNPDRVLKKLYVTPARQKDYETFSDRIKIQTVTKEELDRLLPNGATHQGVALSSLLKDIAENKDFTKTSRPVIILDGLSDPQNIGSILRTSAAFGVQHIIMQEKGSPDITGTLAKAAAGAVEFVNLHKVTNLVRALEQLKDAGFIVYGADGASEQGLSTISFPQKTVIVVGSEGNGIRRLVKSNCDMLFKIPMCNQMESLNVANAFSITLYAVTKDLIESFT